MSFKVKPDKVKHAIEINTLDETHRKIMNNFQKRKKMLPKKKQKLQQLKNKLDELEKQNASNYTAEDIKKRSSLKTEIKMLTNEIYDIDNDVSEIDYYYKTESIIMDYYEIMDHDDHILYEEHPELCEAKKKNKEQPEIDQLLLLNQLNRNKKKPKKVTKRRKKRSMPLNSNNILEYLSMAGKEKETETETEIETEISENSQNINENDEDKLRNKAELLDKYMVLVNGEFSNRKNGVTYKMRKCDDCGIEKTLIHADSNFVCPNCGEVEMIIMDSEKPNYKEAVTDSKPGYPYKRIDGLCVIVLLC